MVGWGRNSYSEPAEIAFFSRFPGRILAEAVSMIHFGMLYRLDVSTFYFYELLPFQIFVT